MQPCPASLVNMLKPIILSAEGPILNGIDIAIIPRGRY